VIEREFGMVELSGIKQRWPVALGSAPARDCSTLVMAGLVPAMT
jgi:hypothetical protein